MSNQLNKEYWNLRYLNQQTAWDIGFPSPPIVKWFDKQKNLDLKILVPGAGSGHEVIYAFNKGFKHIYYMDFAIDAVESFKKKCPNFPKNQILTDDFFSLRVKNYFDIIIEQTFFCAQNPNKRKNYVIKTHELLKLNGRLIGLLFDFEFDKEGPPFGGRRKEYQRLFNKKFKMLEMCTSNLSINPRKGVELWIDFLKNEN